MWYTTHDRWQVAGDRWQVTHDFYFIIILLLLLTAHAKRFFVYLMHFFFSSRLYLRLELFVSSFKVLVQNLSWARAQLRMKIYIWAMLGLSLKSTCLARYCLPLGKFYIVISFKPTMKFQKYTMFRMKI